MLPSKTAKSARVVISVNSLMIATGRRIHFSKFLRPITTKS